MLADRPVTFNEMVAAATGKQVLSSSGHYLRFGHYPPDVVHLDDGTVAPERIVSSAWYHAGRNESKHREELEAQVDNCPGVLDAETTVNGTAVTVKICGKSALNDLDHSVD